MLCLSFMKFKLMTSNGFRTPLILLENNILKREIDKAHTEKVLKEPPVRIHKWLRIIQMNWAQWGQWEHDSIREYLNKPSIRISNEWGHQEWIKIHESEEIMLNLKNLKHMGILEMNGKHENEKILSRLTENLNEAQE